MEQVKQMNQDTQELSAWLRRKSSTGRLGKCGCAAMWQARLRKCASAFYEGLSSGRPPRVSNRLHVRVRWERLARVASGKFSW